jgi:hypothetical protein
MILRQEQLSGYSAHNPEHTEAIAQRRAWMIWAKTELEGKYFIPFGEFFLYVDAAAESSDTKVGDGLDRIVDVGGDLLDRVTDPEMRQTIRENLGYWGRLAVSHGTSGLMTYLFAVVAVGIMLSANLVGGLFGGIFITQGISAANRAILMPHIVGMVALLVVGASYYRLSSLEDPWRGIVSFVVPPVAWLGITLAFTYAVSGAEGTFIYVGPSISSVVLALFWGLVLLAPLGMLAELIHGLTQRAGDSTLLKIVDRFLRYTTKEVVTLPAEMQANATMKSYERGPNHADHFGTVAALAALVVLWIVTTFHWGLALAFGEMLQAFGLSSIGLIGMIASFEVMRRNYWTLFATEADLKSGALNVNLRYGAVKYMGIGAVAIPLIQTLGTGLYWWMTKSELVSSAYKGVTHTIGYNWWMFSNLGLATCVLCFLAAVWSLRAGNWKVTGALALGAVVGLLIASGSYASYDSGPLTMSVLERQIQNVQLPR